MNLYDECLTGVQALLAQYPAQPLAMPAGAAWPDAGKNQILLPRETAFELGAGTLPAVSSLALTDSEAFVPRDQVLLIGDDLPAIRQDRPFARIAMIRVDESAMGSGEALYRAIRNIEFARYRLHPEGYMMRISAFTHREAARVSKRALKDGLGFAQIGKCFLAEYHKLPQVQAVQLLFVTDPAFPFETLEAIMQKSESITAALDHLMNKVKMDCSTCSLKTVCDEVEALCEQAP